MGFRDRIVYTFTMSKDYPRDMLGYGRLPPRVSWPGNARLALQIVLNYEEGGERNVLHGDDASEVFLSEIANAQPYSGVRHKSMESLYEYGSRVGVWRLLEIFRSRNIPITVFAVAMAIERNPEVAKAVLEAGHEVACHGLRWIDYQFVDEQTERAHMAEAVSSLTRLCGQAPLGWYTGRDSPQTRKLVVQHGGFLYDSDSYSDDLPYYEEVEGQSHLVIPYTLDCNDMRFASSQGFSHGQEFFEYLKNSFDTLYREGQSHPRMMSVGLHCRLAGKPGRSGAVEKFLDHVAEYDDVWICRRVDIARHWLTNHPP